MKLPPGRDVRAALDSMLEGFCEHHFAVRLTDLPESEQIELQNTFERELGLRVYRLTVKRLKKRGVRV